MNPLHKRLDALEAAIVGTALPVIVIAHRNVAGRWRPCCEIEGELLTCGDDEAEDAFEARVKHAAGGRIGPETILVRIAHFGISSGGCEMA